MEELDDTDADDETEESIVEASDPPTDPSFIEPAAPEAGDRLAPPPLAVSGEAVEGMDANAREGAGTGDVVTVNCG